LDAESLVKLLVRYIRGEKGVWQVLRVPTPAEEDARRIHRERERLIRERTAHQSRIRSLFALHGIVVKSWLRAKELLERVPERIGSEIEREMERRELVTKQLIKLDKERVDSMKDASLPNAEKMHDLERLKGIGANGATVLISEFFGWREFKNGKQVGSCAGLTPTPFASGKLAIEQGISKAGSRRIRALSIELAWSWLRYQPQSALSRWFEERFAKGSGRSRRIGIVALARKLLVALWKYTAHGVIPEGAIMKA
jgi:transposase